MSALASALDALEAGAKAKRDLNTPAASTPTPDDAAEKLNDATRRADDLEAELLSQKNAFKAFKDGCLLPDDVDASTPISLLRGLYDKFNLARKECLKIDINPHLGDIDASSAHAALADLATAASSDRRLLALARQALAKLALELDVQDHGVDAPPLHEAIQHISKSVSAQNKNLVRAQRVLNKLAADPDFEDVDTSSAHAALTRLGDIVSSERKLFSLVLSQPKMRDYKGGTPAEALNALFESYESENRNFEDWRKETGNTDLSPDMYTAAEDAVEWRDRANEERDAAVAERYAAKRESAIAVHERTKANERLRTAQNDLQVAIEAKDHALMTAERALDQIDNATRPLNDPLGPKVFTSNSSLLQLVSDIGWKWERSVAAIKDPNGPQEPAEPAPEKARPRVDEIVTSVLSPIFFSEALELDGVFEGEDMGEWAQDWASNKLSSEDAANALRGILQTSDMTRDSIVRKLDDKLRFCNEHKDIMDGAERVARAWAKRPLPDDVVDACLQLFASAITARALGMDLIDTIVTGFQAALEHIDKN